VTATVPTAGVERPEPGAENGEQSVSPAPAPVAPAGATVVGFGGSLALVGLGAIAIRDALVATGLVGGEQWLPAVGRAITGIQPAPWTIPLAVALAVVGLLFVAIAFAPRRRTAVPLSAGTAVYLGNRDVATVARVTAAQVPGVLDARASSSRRRVVVSCGTTSDAQNLRATVTDEVTRALNTLERRPRVVVRTRSEKSS
jgi:hypothetical protein